MCGLIKLCMILFFKVWSDLKTNTKRKAVRIYQAQLDPSGPLLNIELSELEERVLNIIGIEAATGLPKVLEPAGLPMVCSCTSYFSIFT